MSSYGYLYDDRLSDRKYDREISRLEGELSQRGMNGRIGRFALFRHVRDIVSDLMRTGAQTLVVVGDDKTLFATIGALGEHRPVIGYIRLIAAQSISKSLAIPVGVPAVDILAARFIHSVDLGMAGSRPFLSELRVDGPGLSIRVDNMYRLEPPPGGSIIVRNIGGQSEPSDGLLDLIIQPPEERRTFFDLRRMLKAPETHVTMKEGLLKRQVTGSCSADGIPLEGEELVIGIRPGGLKMIIGRRGRGMLARSAGF